MPIGRKPRTRRQNSFLFCFLGAPRHSVCVSSEEEVKKTMEIMRKWIDAFSMELGKLFRYKLRARALFGSANPPRGAGNKRKKMETVHPNIDFVV